jgi:hypothetical protein
MAGATRTGLDDELLRPSLPPDLDTGHFRQPWQPGSLTVAAFFGGLLTAGAAFGLNWGRLGRPERGWRCLALAVAAAVVAYGALLALVSAGHVGEEEGVLSAGTMRLLMRGVAAAFGMFVARGQEPLVRLHVGAGGLVGKAFWPCLGLVVAGGLAEVALVKFVALVLATAGLP